ncbi:HD domain-containing protein [Vagococcus salmoninarum]|uniref:Metal-dependent phosphohydrolase n=1 Tax=Vagococcus salmoninarum TaxID=2739 RepID=A0A429ZIN8_9ENTE|nr:HD domain-containing protein [Vagococcus salmoninarum]RST93543.1 metal-dependent phosphohydrolase [Vagococcus salmoninarum]
MNQSEQLVNIKAYAEQVLAGDASGHSMDHIERVVKMAERLAESETCDLFLIQAAAYLHDVTDDKLVPDVLVAEQELNSFLQEIQLTSQQIAEIADIIENVSFSHSLGKEPVVLSIEAQIVQDADRLDAIGATGIARTFYYGGKTGHKIHDPAILPRDLQSKAEYRVNETVINHFYEKLLKIPSLLNTTLAQEIGKERLKMMEDFLRAFMKEWSGN